MEGSCRATDRALGERPTPAEQAISLPRVTAVCCLPMWCGDWTAAGIRLRIRGRC